MPSFFTARNWAKLIHSGGQSEQGAQMAAANMCAASINLADGENWDDWVKTRESLKAAGLRVVVGGRVINFGNALDGVETLLEIAIEHDVDCVANIEDEFKDTTPAAFEERISSVIAANPQWKREFVINTIGWLYNAVDFTPLNHRPVVLQCYPSDNKWAQSEVEQKTADCIWHASHDKGFTDIGVCFEATDHQTDPSWYAFWNGKPRSYFTGDWIGARGAWPAWGAGAPAGCSQPSPDPVPPDPVPPTNGGDVQKIGSQDGVVAEYNRLRDLDPSGTLLQKVGGKWQDISTIADVPLQNWKAYDKAQRRAQILVDDHDAQMN